MYLTLGRTEDALKQYQDYLKISRQLATDDPKDAQKQRDLSISFNKLGDVYLTLGRTEDALKQYQDGLKISRQLATDDPKDAQKQRDLMLSSYKLGMVAKELGSYTAAIKRFHQGVAILDELIEARLQVESACAEKSILEREMNYCRRAPVATGDWEALLKSDAKQLPDLLGIRATEFAKRGRLADVEQAAAKLREWKPATGGTLYDSACAYGLCAHAGNQREDENVRRRPETQTEVHRPGPGMPQGSHRGRIQQLQST